MLKNRVDRKNDMIHVCLNNTEYRILIREGLRNECK